MAKTIVQVFLLNGVPTAISVLDNGSIISEPYTGGAISGGPPSSIVDLCNMALDQLNGTPQIGGQWGLNAGELSAPTSPQGVLLARNYIDWAQEVMRACDWRSLRSRTQLLGNGTVVLTLADTTTPGAYAAGDTITATPATAYFTSKDVGRTLFEQAVPPATTAGLNGTATITAVSSDLVPVATATVVSVFSSASLPTLAVQGWGLRPLAEFGFAYQLPSDYLKMLRLLDSTGKQTLWTYGAWPGHGVADPWSVEGQWMLTDVTPSPIAVYTYFEPDPSKWDKGLREAIIAKYAAELTWPLTKNEKMKAMNFQIYTKKLAAADAESKEERQRRGYSPTTFLDVRG
jgi:hypothetical protein